MNIIMKINISAEKTGEEVVNDMAAALVASSVPVKEGGIKAQVINKEGKWVDFDYSKIRFTYST